MVPVWYPSGTRLVPELFRRKKRALTHHSAVKRCSVQILTHTRKSSSNFSHFTAQHRQWWPAPDSIISGQGAPANNDLIKMNSRIRPIFQPVRGVGGLYPHQSNPIDERSMVDRSDTLMAACLHPSLRSSLDLQREGAEPSQRLVHFLDLRFEHHQLFDAVSKRFGLHGLLRGKGGYHTLYLTVPCATLYPTLAYPALARALTSNPHLTLKPTPHLDPNRSLNRNCDPIPNPNPNLSTVPNRTLTLALPL